MGKWCQALRMDGTELRHLLQLMVPLYLANLMGMGMGVVDTIVAGRAGTTDLAAVALGCSVMAPAMVSIGTVLSIIGPMVSRLRGAGEENKVGLLLNNGKTLAFALMLFELVVLYAGTWLLRAVASTEELGDMACEYIYYIMLCIPASVGMRLLQANFEGFGKTRPAFIVSTLGLLANIPLDYALVFGWCGIPAMGGPGCGLATSLIHWLMFAAMFLLSLTRRHRGHIRQMLQWRAPGMLCGRILRLGFPLGVATLCEMSFFSVVVQVIAPLGELMVSAQQVAINISGVIFMLPLSMGMAASIRAAFHVGSQNKAAFDAMVRTLFVSSYTLVLVLMVCTIVFRIPIVSFYTENPTVISTASVLLIYCGVYQISDATQCLTASLLRGCHDTAVITWVNLGCYWIIGFPLACILIRTDWIVPAMGPAGAWVSFIISLTLTAVLLVRRFRRTRIAVFSR